ncbi:putative transmembrane protein [Gregarina niphandrodes]|uniref:Transmembrane protein n=1 Tax=Gregarina niphandrodes TaxID=110365 RepID=A0A023AY16_GRENI|nr:putative transmembrane protein [Gregarina niphandrodes]EZG43546.1 putative transmembrane protein [Gregarina niphandrodes]|eukprot:XP_011133231.1 putative transmembrane protein [Gregarina niphandrodes]
MLRVDRLKQCSKVKNFYKYAFKIEEPYRMLLDPHFVEHAAQVNIPIRQFVETNLEAKVEFSKPICLSGLCMWPMYVAYVCGLCMWPMYVAYVCD